MRTTARHGLKIVIVGGFGVGKTTMVSSLSEIRPLTTEEVMSSAGAGIDDTTDVRGKRRTTVAFDFGRITLNARQVLYLFGAPGQERFWYVWDQLFTGSLGAVVLVDTRRIADCWYALDRLEQRSTPFVVAVNRFTGSEPGLDKVRDSLAVDSHVPVVDCDARHRDSCKHVLVSLVTYLSERLAQSPAPEVTP